VDEFMNVTGRFVVLAVAIAATAVPARAADGPGAVFTLTNSPAGNGVVRYARAADGSLALDAVYPTGGTGSGAGLGSQNSVIVSDDHRLLFAVNAGSNSVSAFRVEPDGLALVDVAPSGGTMPISVTFARGLLYVLNAGTPNNISGFTVDDAGHMAPLAGSTRPLSGGAAAPAQVQFDDDGESLIVTEKATSLIDVYTVAADGLAAGPFVYPSSGPTPFGFAVTKRNTLFVSEAGAGGGASTYTIGDGAALLAASANVMTGQRAACWAVVTKNGRFGYVTNAGTGNISGFAIAPDGSAALLDASGVTAITGGNPTDAALSHDSRYLYARVAATNRIAIFRIQSDGSLTEQPALTGTPSGLVGLAAY
jgi:6-phosphogluconolactonase (cycloisomerase 2 family)